MENQIVIPFNKIKNFVEKSLTSVGVPINIATETASNLIEADIKGHYSHGVSRLPFYINDLTSGITSKDGNITIVKEKFSTCQVNGNNLLGAYVGSFCIKKAIELAKKYGVGMVTAKQSNHFGICSYYSEMAEREGLIGMVFTNTSPCVFNCRSSEKGMGSNPISFAAPSLIKDDNFSLDMATTTVAYGKIEVIQRKGEDEIPISWGANKNGIQSRSANEILTDGGLMPLGGIEETGGYKGSGLGMMVELLCGVLSGASYGKNIRFWQKDTSGMADLGQCFIVIDPNCFEDNFEERCQQYLDETRNLKPVEKGKNVLVPGDIERKRKEMCIKKGGVIYEKYQIDILKKLALQLNLDYTIFF
ncbi:Malate/L-lactate dehydrogenase family-containing protein [Strongyloides ratti]|uniref:Malate/L-lactate dehydrogenase family-containing protein n=1 Tax=Strongyloides ratti TaxID=34506 RepID=A0A090MXD1_STRRB|nr:Malate/L-lactate dehydrogenase family-containing protein [Strongyloides ratti]CEF65224.1 Malate/L-lactate dehydrogenase family-containing protein [Strongyloides ratti]